MEKGTFTSDKYTLIFGQAEQQRDDVEYESG